MSEAIVTIAGMMCVAAVVLVSVYRLSPGLSDAMSAWAKKQQDLTNHRLIEEWARGVQEGQEFERRKQEGTR